MKTPKEQIMEFVEKHYLKEKDKWESGLSNHYMEWEDIKYKIFKEQDNSFLYEKIDELERIIKRFEYDTGISRTKYKD